MENSLAYIVLILFFALCAFQYEYTESRKKQTIVVLLCIAIFFIFFGFRGFVFTDWTDYYLSFEKAEWSDFKDWSLFSDDDDKKIAEPAFMLLVRLCKSLINNYTFFIAVLTSINTALFIRFLKWWHIDNIPFAMMVFVAFWGLNIMFDLLRNSISIFIFINSLEYIRDRKILQYMGLCLLAMSFHLSSIIFFPLYFVMNIKLNKWVFLGIFLGLFIFFISHQSLIALFLNIAGLEGSYGVMLKAYTDLYDTARPFSLFVTIEHFILAGLIFIYYDKIIDNDKGRIIIVNSLILYFIMFYLLSDFHVLSVRMSTLFVFSYWILWYDIIKKLTIRNNKIILSSYIVLYSMFIVYANNKAPVYKYDNVLFGSDSYEQRLSVFNKTFSEFGR